MQGVNMGPEYRQKPMNTDVFRWFSIFTDNIAPTPPFGPCQMNGNDGGWEGIRFWRRLQLLHPYTTKSLATINRQYSKCHSSKIANTPATGLMSVYEHKITYKSSK